MRTTPASWILACLLAGSACTAHAEPSAWNFSYTGFFVTSSTIRPEGDVYVESFEPAEQITGRFIGEDDDGNGILELGELSVFILEGRDYLPCIANPSPYGRCSIGSFSYGQDGELDFSANWNSNDDFFSSWTSSMTSGVSARYVHSSLYSETTRMMYWTEETRFHIVAAPVPEPATGAMAVAGLMLLAGLRRRHAG